MRVLAIDTSGALGVIAVTIDSEPCAEFGVRVEARHGETILPNLERALAIAGIGIADVDLLAVGLGPGSFTGVRIAVATVKGLALARSTPVVGVRTTRVIARGAFGALRVPVVDAHKGEVFVAVYAADADGNVRAVLDESHGPPDAMAALVRACVGEGAAPVTLVGTGLPRFGAAFGAALGVPHVFAPRAIEAPRGSLLALEAERAFAERGADDLASLVPVYVRASDAVASPSIVASRVAADR